MIINHEHRFVYLAVPRTASTAISHSLQRAFPGSVNMGQHRMNIPVECTKGDYTIIAGVRNPYQRMASHYLHRRDSHPRSVWHWTFHEYIAQLEKHCLHWWGLADDPPACSWLRDIEVSHLLRYESLEQQWNELSLWQRVGFIPRLLHRNANSANRNSWHALYTRELADRVFHLQREDFEQHGYHQDSWRRNYAVD
nr:sulfotransferase family 2 domain-containing protein [Halioglobus japonicus]